MSELVYTVKFRPDRYKYARSEARGLQQPTWLIGRDDDAGTVVAFAFEEEAAKQICFALNLADAYITGDTNAKKNLLALLEKLKTH
jgi:hypothetical protein